MLPFVPRSSDEESKSLAEGLTDDITSGLSRFGYLHVLSRSISERLAREHTQVNTHARYTLEGNVRKSGTQVRIGITLVDTQAGTNLWTQNYDRDAGSGMFVAAGRRGERRGRGDRRSDRRAGQGDGRVDGGETRR